MGDAPSNEIWHSVLHLVSSQGGPARPRRGEDGIHPPGSRTGAVNEAFLQCAAYILGEYGGAAAVEVHKANGTNGVNGTNGAVNSQSVLLHRHYHVALRPQCQGDDAQLLREDAHEGARQCGAGERRSTPSWTPSSRSIDPESPADGPSSILHWPANPETGRRRARGPCRRGRSRTLCCSASLIVGNDLDSQESCELQPGWIDDQIDWGKDPGATAGVNVAGPEHVEDAEAIEEAEAQAPQVANLMDLLTFGDDDEIQPMAASATVAALPGGADNLGGELSSLEDASHPPGDQRETQAQTIIATQNPLFVGDEDPPPRQAAGSSTDPLRPIASWRGALCGSEAGVLFEDGNLQVGVRMHADAPIATVELDFFVGNKTTDEIQLTGFEPLRIDPDQFDMALADHPRKILPGQQIHVTSKWTCLVPYSSLPELQIEYNTAEGDTGVRAAHVLALPLSVNKFAKPAAIPAEIFLKRWNQVLGPPFKLSRSLRGDFRDKGAIEASLVSFGLHPVVVPALGPRAVSGAAIFHCANGKLNQVPCMVSVTVDGASSSVEVTTADPDVSFGYLTGLVCFLEAIV